MSLPRKGPHDGRTVVNVVFHCYHCFLLLVCYLSPNLKIEKYLLQLDLIMDVVKKFRSNSVIILGDFNANSTIWGSNHTLQEVNTSMS